MIVSPGIGELGTITRVSKLAGTDGQPIWTAEFPFFPEGTMRMAVAIGANGDITLAGLVRDSATGFLDFFVIGCGGTDGTLRWSKRFPGALDDYRLVPCLACDAAGDVFFASTMRTAGIFDYYTAKFASADGALIWERKYDGPVSKYDFLHGMAVDPTGNVVVTGDTWNGSNSDFTTVKYSGLDGALIWARSYNGQSQTAAGGSAVAIDSVGTVTVTGISYETGARRVLTLRYSSMGELLWPSFFDGAGAGDAEPSIQNSLVLTPDGGAAVVGRTNLNTSGGTDNALLVLRYSVDRSTQPASLSEPSGATYVGESFPIEFTLPEAALAGTVRLIFRNSEVQHLFTLTAQHEGQGHHTFAFDPLQPGSGGDVIASNPLPDGLYDVVLAYADQSSNPSAESNIASGVRVDTAPPVITLIGPALVEITTGQSWSDPGATALDDVAGGLSVVVNSNVNTAVPGTYAVAYHAQDPVGNAATSSRSVHVIPAAYAAWKQSYFGAEAANQSIAGDLADPNQNGLVNLLEYALGGDPLNAAVQSDFLQIAEDGAHRLVLRFTRAEMAQDVTLSVEAADSPAGPWTEIARRAAGSGSPVVPTQSWVLVSETALAPGLIRVQVTEDAPKKIPDQRGRFLRVRVGP